MPSSIDRRGLLGVLATSALALSWRDVASAQPAPVPHAIRVGVGAADAYAEGFYAMEKGFFSKAQLDVELVLSGSGGNNATLVAGNALEIGISNTVNLAVAIAHGAPFTIVAGGGLYTAKAPTTAVVVAKDSPVKTARDLVGKTVAVTALKDLTEVGVRAWLDRNGVDSKSVRFVESQMALMPPALGRGTYDAALIGEPYLSVDVGSSLRILGDAYAVLAPQFLISNFFTTTGYFKANTALIRRFVATIYDTARWANANHTESGQIFLKAAKFDPATLAKMGRCEYATSLDPRYIDPILTAMYKYEAIDKKLTSADLVAKV
jgi:NitT/TauT family transport system substrate-binding protein